MMQAMYFRLTFFTFQFNVKKYVETCFFECYNCICLYIWAIKSLHGVYEKITDVLEIKHMYNSMHCKVFGSDMRLFRMTI